MVRKRDSESLDDDGGCPDPKRIKNDPTGSITDSSTDDDVADNDNNIVGDDVALNISGIYI